MVIDLCPDLSAEEPDGGAPVSYPNARAHFMAATEKQGLQMFIGAQA